MPALTSSGCSPSRPAAYGCLALSMALVGSYVALSKPLAALFPVLLLAWLRFGIGAVAMAGWLRRPAGEAPVDRSTRWLLFLESFFGNFLFTVCMVTGVSLTSAVTAGVTMSAIPVAVALLSWVLLKERIAPRTWLAVALAVGGIAGYALARPQAVNAPAVADGRMWLGQTLLLAAVLCEAAYAVIGKRLTATLSARRISAIINLWGLVLSTPAGLYLAWHFDFGSVGAGMWLLLLFYALAACVWTVWLWMTGLRAVPAAQAGVMTVMLPISAALVGVMVLDEQIGAAQLLALGVALLGVLVATWPQRRTAGLTICGMQTDFSSWPIAVVTTTVANAEAAQQLAQAAVQVRLAACVQVEPITSHYIWQGQLEAGPEWRLVFKTQPEAVGHLHQWMLEHHPYDVPQWLVRIEHADAGYGRWVAEQVTLSSEK